MSVLKIGDLAPNFSLLNQFGEKVELKQFRGKNRVVVYFYPKALTPGCTTQACGIRDSSEDWKKFNTVVLGISPDLPAALQKFDKKHNLGFTLLSDDNHAVAESYGVWGLKKFMGKEFIGIIRTTFIINLNGEIEAVFDKVRTATHSDDLKIYINGCV